MLLSQLMSPPRLQQHIDKGLVTVRTHPDDPYLKILNYTDKAQFENCWNEVTTNCRGLIVRGKNWNNAYLVARPFEKFFNYGQPQAPEIDGDAWVVAYDKMDGSLGILYWAPDGRPAIATRGSFTSEQALHATQVYRDRYEGKWEGEHFAVGGITYLFEIIYPDNRIVLDYNGLDDLVLLGARNRSTGMVDGPRFVQLVDRWPGPISERIHRGWLSAVLALPNRPNAEGLVLVLPDGSRVKVKQEDYVTLHKAIFGLNERAIWEAMIERRYHEFVEALPDEFHQWAKDVQGRLNREFDRRWYAVWSEHRRVRAALMQRCMGPVEPSRRDFAEAVKDHPDKALLFLCEDDADSRIADAIWKQIKPAHTPYVRTETEAA